MQTVEEFSAFLQSTTKQTFCALISLSSLRPLKELRASNVQLHTETTDIKIHHAARTAVVCTEHIKGYNLYQYRKCDN